MVVNCLVNNSQIPTLCMVLGSSGGYKQIKAGANLEELLLLGGDALQGKMKHNVSYGCLWGAEEVRAGRARGRVKEDKYIAPYKDPSLQVIHARQGKQETDNLSPINLKDS